MNDYVPSIPRAALAFVAAAMSALTFGLTVVAPASMAPDCFDGRILAAHATSASTPYRQELRDAVDRSSRILWAL